MTVTKRYFLLWSLTAITALTSFMNKDVNEHSKWLKFYGLKETDFKVRALTDSIDELNWEPSGITDDYIKCFSDLCFFSPDSTFFLNLNTYGEPDEEVTLVRRMNYTSSRLLYFGPGNFAETAYWTDKGHFEILGFINEDLKFIPTIWKYDLDKGICNKLKCKISYKELPNKIYRKSK